MLLRTAVSEHIRCSAIGAKCFAKWVIPRAARHHGWMVSCLRQRGIQGWNYMFFTVTDAFKPGVAHRQHRCLNNRAENSYQPTRERERRMRRFKSARYARRFVEVHGIVASHFRPRHASCSPPPIIETSAANGSEFGMKRLERPLSPDHRVRSTAVNRPRIIHGWPLPINLTVPMQMPTAIVEGDLDIFMQVGRYWSRLKARGAARS